MSTRTVVHLVRHGEVENPNGLLYERLPGFGLSERGREMARLAAEDGVRREDAFDPGLLSHPTEATLLATLGDFPRVVAHAAELREPHRVARYLETLAGHFHKWYDTCRVRPRSDEELTDTHRTRLWLNDATRQVLANGLDLLGVSAPERM